MKNDFASLLPLMLALLRAEVLGEEPSGALEESLRTCSDDERMRLYRLAKAHDLAHLVGDAALRKGWIPEGECKQKFEKQIFLAVSRYRVTEHELERVGALFAEEKIPYIPLKGSVLRKTYPAPWMRTSCDVDVLVEEKNLEAALSALKNRYGYTVEEKGPHDVGTTAPSGVRLELHYRLTEDAHGRSDLALRADAPLIDVFAEAKPSEEGSYRYLLPPELFYYYHVYHMAKHFQNGGCGIRPFLDLLVMRSFVYDEDEKARRLAEGGLDSFARAAEKLASVWFSDGTHDPLSERMEEYVLAGGTYGNLENRATLRSVQKGGKLRFVLSRLFLPYDAMRYRYPKLEKHKWLLPYYEVRRWFERLFSGKWKQGSEELSAVSSSSEEQVRDMKKMLSELGFVSKGD